MTLKSWLNGLKEWLIEIWIEESPSERWNRGSRYLIQRKKDQRRTAAYKHFVRKRKVSRQGDYLVIEG